VKVRYLPQYVREGDDRLRGRIAQAGECRDGGYRYCLLADYRDVFFQRDPFSKFPVGKDLVFAQGDGGSTIGNEYWNRQWMRKCLGSYSRGKNWTHTIYNQNIICSGTIAGTPAGLIALAENLERASRVLPNCNGGPLDQALLNVIVHWATTEPTRTPSMHPLSIQIEPTGKGMITTLGYSDVEHSRRGYPFFKRNSEGENLELGNKTVSAVIHQYDRFPELLPTQIPARKENAMASSDLDCPRSAAVAPAASIH